MVINLPPRLPESPARDPLVARAHRLMLRLLPELPPEHPAKRLVEEARAVEQPWPNPYWNMEAALQLPLRDGALWGDEQNELESLRALRASLAAPAPEDPDWVRTVEYDLARVPPDWEHRLVHLEQLDRALYLAVLLREYRSVLERAAPNHGPGRLPLPLARGLVNAILGQLEAALAEGRPA